jgi:hypothetical protein
MPNGVVHSASKGLSSSVMVGPGSEKGEACQDIGADYGFGYGAAVDPRIGRLSFRHLLANNSADCREAPMTAELYWLTLTALLTALMWVPYILNRIAVQGLMAAMSYDA